MMSLAAYAGTSLLVEMEITGGLRNAVQRSKFPPIKYFAGEGWLCTYCTGLQLLLGMWIIEKVIPAQHVDHWWSFVGLGAATGILWIAYDVTNLLFSGKS